MCGLNSFLLMYPKHFKLFLVIRISFLAVPVFLNISSLFTSLIILFSVFIGRIMSLPLQVSSFVRKRLSYIQYCIGYQIAVQYNSLLLCVIFFNTLLSFWKEFFAILMSCHFLLLHYSLKFRHLFKFLYMFHLYVLNM